MTQFRKCQFLALISQDSESMYRSKIICIYIRHLYAKFQWSRLSESKVRFEWCLHCIAIGPIGWNDLTAVMNRSSNQDWGLDTSFLMLSKRMQTSLYDKLKLRLLDEINSISRLRIYGLWDDWHNLQITAKTAVIGNVQRV